MDQLCGGPDKIATNAGRFLVLEKICSDQRLLDLLFLMIDGKAHNSPSLTAHFRPTPIPTSLITSLEMHRL